MSFQQKKRWGNDNRRAGGGNGNGNGGYGGSGNGFSRRGGSTSSSSGNSNRNGGGGNRRAGGGGSSGNRYGSRNSGGGNRNGARNSSGGGRFGGGRGGGGVDVGYKLPLNVVAQMMGIFGTMVAVLIAVLYVQTPGKNDGSFFPDKKKHPSKYAYEKYVLQYTPCWMFVLGIICVMQLYEDFDSSAYNVVCGCLALPLMLQPHLLPTGPDEKRKWWERYSTKANLWIAIYSFIGNYWYTHYFYNIMNAEYTMPATRLNNVPIPVIFASYFCYSTYHVFSNALMRKVETTYEKGSARTLLLVTVVIIAAYTAAFIETVFCSSFPYYKFNYKNDWDMALTSGSALYAIYFAISFPAFYYFDRDIDVKADDDDKKKPRKVTLWDTALSTCGYSMMTLMALDFVRLYLEVPLNVKINYNNYY